MPEIISKYPEITLKVLESAGAVCGKGEPQQILKACPPERFCSFPGGEICVYGLDEIEKMTQIKKAELIQIIEEPREKKAMEKEMKEIGFNLDSLLLMGLALVFGVVVGYLIKSRKK